MSSLEQEMAGMYPLKKVVSPDKCTCASATSSKKWKISLIAGILFFIISSPMLYKVVDGLGKKLSGKLEIVDYYGKPTTLGLLVHSVVFILITRLMMRK